MKKSKNKFLYFVVAVLIIAVIALIIQNQIVLKKTESKSDLSEKVMISDDYVISKLSEQEFLFNKTPTYVKQITKTELSELVEKYPAIYDESMQGYFDVRYEDYWIIYDPIDDVVVKKIFVQGMKIS